MSAGVWEDHDSEPIGYTVTAAGRAAVLRETYTVDEAAAIAGLHPTSVAHLVHRGDIAAERVGRFWLLDGDSVRQWVAGRGRRVPIEPLVRMLDADGGPAEARLWADDTLSQAYVRGLRSGELTLYQADQLAVRVLGVHPAAVWGRSWFGMRAG